jgi:hypothetical protein
MARNMVGRQADASSTSGVISPLRKMRPRPVRTLVAWEPRLIFSAWRRAALEGKINQYRVLVHCMGSVVATGARGGPPWSLRLILRSNAVGPSDPGICVAQVRCLRRGHERASMIAKLCVDALCGDHPRIALDGGAGSRWMQRA